MSKPTNPVPLDFEAILASESDSDDDQDIDILEDVPEPAEFGELAEAMPSPLQGDYLLQEDGSLIFEQPFQDQSEPESDEEEALGYISPISLPSCLPRIWMAQDPAVAVADQDAAVAEQDAVVADQDVVVADQDAAEPVP